MALKRDSFFFYIVVLETKGIANGFFDIGRFGSEGVIKIKKKWKNISRDVLILFLSLLDLDIRH